MFEFLNDIKAQHLFIAAAGQIIHILMRLLKLYKAKQQFIWKTFAIENALESIIAGLIITVLLIVLKDEMTNTLALTVGYSADSAFKQVMARSGMDKQPEDIVGNEINQ